MSDHINELPYYYVQTKTPDGTIITELHMREHYEDYSERNDDS